MTFVLCHDLENLLIRVLSTVVHPWLPAEVASLLDVPELFLTLSAPELGRVLEFFFFSS